MPILVIEDEPKTGDYLQRGLTESGFAVRLARNGRDGLALAAEDEIAAADEAVAAEQSADASE